MARKKRKVEHDGTALHVCILITFLGAVGVMLSAGSEIFLLVYGSWAVVILGLLGVFLCSLRDRKRRSRRWSSRKGGRKFASPPVIAGLTIGGVLLVAIVIGSIMMTGFSGSQRAANERSTWASLKTLATAEADFRANDRDGNRIQDFWTGDVSQLYGLVPAGLSDGKPVRLIERNVGGADSSPMKGGVVVSKVINDAGATTTDISTLAIQGPRRGYWYEALTADLGAPGKPVYRTDTDGSGSLTRHVLKFGFIAWPEAGDDWVYIINESNKMYRRKPAPTGVLPSRSGKSPPGPITSPTYSNWPAGKDLAAEWE